MGYDQEIYIPVKYKKEAKLFFDFLKNIGKKSSRPVRILYHHKRNGCFNVSIDGLSRNINSFFLEIIMNKVLHYYTCLLKGKSKKRIINKCLIPIFKSLLEERFPAPYCRFVKKYFSNNIYNEEQIPGLFLERHSHEFEILIEKWNLKIINDWDIIKDLDSFLTRFFLQKINHEPEKRSPKFNSLVEKVKKMMGETIDKELAKKFKKIHKLRIGGLHRLKSVSKDDFSDLISDIYVFFRYLDDFKIAQLIKSVKSKDRVYRRVRYGYEKFTDENGEPYKDDKGNVLNMRKYAKEGPCHDCGATYGQLHLDGCDVEVCPKCGKQAISCDCELEEIFPKKYTF